MHATDPEKRHALKLRKNSHRKSCGEGIRLFGQRHTMRLLLMPRPLLQTEATHGGAVELIESEHACKLERGYCNIEGNQTEHKVKEASSSTL